jgi:ketosteroid isomerase-like protein
MSIEANVALARQWVDAVNRRDVAALGAILADDYEYSGMGHTPKELRVRWNKKTMLDIMGRVAVVNMKRPVIMTVTSAMGEGDWVTLEMVGDSETKDGRIYANAYCFLYEINGDKIKAVHDYCCTETAVRQRGQPGKALDNVAS